MARYTAPHAPAADQQPLPDPTLRRRLRQRRTKAALILLAVIALPLVLWGFVIPRTDVTITVWYNEGLLNAINVDTKVVNDGTTTLGGVSVHIQVFNDTDRLMAEQQFDANQSVPMYRSLPVPNLSFQGDQRQEYRLLVEVTFTTDGKSFSSSHTYRTDEPALNAIFSSKVQGFG